MIVKIEAVFKSNECDGCELSMKHCVYCAWLACCEICEGEETAKEGADPINEENHIVTKNELTVMEGEKDFSMSVFMILEKDDDQPDTEEPDCFSAS